MDRCVHSIDSRHAQVKFDAKPRIGLSVPPADPPKASLEKQLGTALKLHDQLADQLKNAADEIATIEGLIRKRDAQKVLAEDTRSRMAHAFRAHIPDSDQRLAPWSSDVIAGILVAEEFLEEDKGCGVNSGGF